MDLYGVSFPLFHHPVLFVGSSHNDEFVRFLEKFLPAHEAEPRWILAGEGDPLLEARQNWEELGYGMIGYPQESKDDHCSLPHYIETLNAQLHVHLQSQLKIESLAGNPPSKLDKHESEQLKQYLLQGHSPVCFTQYATSPH